MSLNGRKITRETAWGENLLFFPNSEKEAGYLQKRLLEEGFVWKDGDTNVAELETTRKKGLVVYDGIMSIKGDSGSRVFTVCPIRQMDEDCPPPEEKRQQDVFNRLAEKLERIEERLNAIEAQLAPESLDKPHVLKPPQGPPRSSGS